MTDTPLFPSAAEADEACLHTLRIASRMAADGLDAILIASNANTYYTALRYFRGYTLILADATVMRFVVRPNTLSGPDTITIRKPEQIPSILAERGITLTGTLGLEMGELSYNDIVRLQKAFPGVATADCTLTLRRARMVKTLWEQQCIARDGMLQAEAYAQVPAIYREGITDIEMQIGLEQALRRLGCLGRARVSGPLMEINMGSLLVGDNANTPSPYDFAMGGAGQDPSLPGGADGSEIRTGQTIMVDMNGCFNGYQSDLTRTWRVGPVNPLAERAHQCSISILRRLEQTALPGTPIASLYHTALSMAEAEGLAPYFMGHRQQAPFIGHGVGIELNEMPAITPRSRDIIEEGMVLALEPKFVIPGTGAVGIENTYVVAADGLRCLTPFPEPLTDLLS